MKRLVPALACVAVASLSAGSQSASRAAPALDVALGVVWLGEFMMPFAGLRDGKWGALTAALPDADNELGLTADAGALPPRGWRLLDSLRPVTSFTLRGRVRGGSHCSTIEGYRTDLPRYTARDPDRESHHVGVALLANAAHLNVELAAVEDVATQPDADSRRVARLVVGVVQSMEANLVGQVDLNEPVELESDGLRLARLPAVTRAAVPVRLMGFWRVGGRSEKRVGGTYYFAAQKDYGKPSGLRTYVTGWIHDERLRVSLSDVLTTVPDGDGKGMTTSHPLGVLRVDGAPFWVVREHHSESEDYVLYDWDSANRGRVLTVQGGGC